MNDPVPVHVLDRQGRLLASCPCILTALDAARRHGPRYAFLVRATDGVELARNMALSAPAHRRPTARAPRAHVPGVGRAPRANARLAPVAADGGLSTVVG